MALSAKVKQEVRSRYQGRCGYCGQHASKLQVDHVRPLAAGGTDDPSNLMPACGPCNNYKMTFSLEEFRTLVSDQVRKARRYSVNFRTAERYGLIEVKPRHIMFYFEVCRIPAVAGQP